MYYFLTVLLIAIYVIVISACVQCKMWIMKQDYHDIREMFKESYQRESVNETLTEG